MKDAYDKIMTLVKELTLRTTAGRMAWSQPLHWTPADPKDVAFSTSLGRYSVIVIAGGHSTSLLVRNSNGQLVDEFDPFNIGASRTAPVSCVEAFDELFIAARRVAMKTDATLDALLAALGY